jgi:arsenate reductase
MATSPAAHAVPKLRRFIFAPLCCDWYTRDDGVYSCFAKSGATSRAGQSRCNIAGDKVMAEPAAETIIYHNPGCSTSRKVLASLREAGKAPVVIEYLKTPPTRAELQDLLRRMDMTPRQLLRRKGTPYDVLGLADTGKTDAELVDAILANPILMERPVVVTPKGVRLCRPIERLQEIM